MQLVNAFDCVEMKNQAQARLAEEDARHGHAEQERRLKEELDHSEDVVARKWRRMAKRHAEALPLTK